MRHFIRARLLTGVLVVVSACGTDQSPEPAQAAGDAHLNDAGSDADTSNAGADTTTEGADAVGADVITNDAMSADSTAATVTALEPGRLTAGDTHSCALIEDGTVRCWGANTSGQLGDGTKSSKSTKPVTVKGLSNVAGITAGEYFTCAWLESGAAWCWGQNSAGQLGDGTTKKRPLPVAVKGLTDVVHMDAGHSHACAVRSSGAVVCWGNNKNGQTGTGKKGGAEPDGVTVAGLGAASSVALGDFFSCAVGKDGTAHCWGSNTFGSLGDGTETNRYTPVKVKGLSGVVAMAASSRHACARLDNKELFCWGENQWGQLGTGTTENHSTPVAPKVVGAVIQVDLGSLHTCALTEVGSVYCWGGNGQSQLGMGAKKAKVPLPRLALKLGGMRAVATGGAHTCAWHSAGKVSCWGEGGNGQLGYGSTYDSGSPKEVAAW